MTKKKEIKNSLCENIKVNIAILSVCPNRLCVEDFTLKLA